MVASCSLCGQGGRAEGLGAGAIFGQAYLAKFSGFKAGRVWELQGVSENQLLESRESRGCLVVLVFGWPGQTTVNGLELVLGSTRNWSPGPATH